MAYTTINKPNLHFNTVLRNGGGGTITGVGFQPDLVWQKARSTASSHYLHDAVRGVTKALFSNSTSAETTYTDQITSFDANGFTVNAGGDWGSGTTIVDWCWKVSPTAGFSIATYTGNGSSNSFAHNLGVTPSMVIIKSRSGARNWYVYHKEVGSSASDSQYYYLNFNTTGTATYAASNWIGTLSNTTVSVGLYTDVVASGENYIAYSFADVKGFSKFGSYTGNSSTNGTFVYTGFKPAWVVLKNITEADGWIYADNKRDTINVASRYILHSTDAEASGNICDFLSNGFKLREGFHGTNTSGQKYIYMAFAEQPLVGTNNVPATAR